MKHREVNRHLGPMRVLQVDAECAGFLVAIGFVVLGLVGLPIGKWFLLAALALGASVACCLRLAKHRSGNYLIFVV